MENKFTVSQKELVSLLASIQPICNKRTTLDVTESVLFQITPRELTLKATDLEVSLRSSLLLEDNAIESASFLVSGKRIFDLVKELDGLIEFTLEKGQIKLKGDGVSLALNIRDAEDFPPFPERIENLMELDSEYILSLLSKVSFLIPQNHSNTALNGMLLLFDKDGLIMVATDGHCLAQVKSNKYTIDEKKSWLLPRRAVLEIKKLLENSEQKTVFLGTCNNQLVFSGNNFNFFTKLLVNPFPKYEAILEKTGFKAATLIRDDMSKALKRANCFLAGQFLSTQFEFNPGKLKISLDNKEVGNMDEVIPLDKYEGNAIESRFYSPYLLGGLNSFSERDINFYVKSSEKPIIFESVGKDYNFTYLVMPVSSNYNGK